MSKTKNAFTFAELLISLTVIAIITVILYPTLSNMAPNNNEYLFKSANRTIETVVSDTMNSDLGTMPLGSNTALCEAFCSKLNRVLTNTAAGNCTNCTTFITSNGMRWAFAINANTGYVLVDVNSQNNNKAGDLSGDNGQNALPVNNMLNNALLREQANNGNFISDTQGVFYTGNSITQDTFVFEIQSNGKIIPLGTVAPQHMQSGN